MNSKPLIIQRNEGIVIKKREFARSVSLNSSGFTIVPPSASIPGFDLNPANAILFPWLSTIAGSYEKYSFESLSFEIVSSCPTSYPGRMYAAFDYDYDDNVPVEKAAIMANKTSADFPVWNTGKLVIDPKILNCDIPWRYTSMNSRLNGVEPRTVYGGFLILATDQPVTNQLTFDIWVDYVVRLKIEVGDSLSPFVASPAAGNVTLNQLSYATIPFTPTSGANFLTSVTAGTNGVPLCGQTPGTTIFMLTPDRPDATLDLSVATSAPSGSTPVQLAPTDRKSVV